MDQRGRTHEVDWPARPDLSLALNRMGTFDWDLDSGRMHLDGTALGVLDLRPEEFGGTPEGLLGRVAPGERARLERRVEEALQEGRSHYGAYFRTLRRDGGAAWTHVQGHVLRDPHGRPYRIIGILRDATTDPNEPGAAGNGDEDAAG